MRYVCIDAGHGSPGSGAVHNGVDEAVYVLAMQYFVEHELALRGVGCVFTRTGPEKPALHERARFARDAHVGGVIVLHVNAAQPQAHGPLAFHNGVDARAMDAAQAFIAKLGRQGEYVEHDLILPMQHQVWVAAAGDWREHAWNCIRWHTEPVVLLELEYCSNVDAAKWMLSDAGRAELTKAIVDTAQVLLG